MATNKKRAFEVLRKLSFERVCGTDNELKGAHILEEECKKAGVDVVIEDFEIDDPIIQKASLEIISPFHKTIPCIGIGKSGNTPEEGITAKFLYVEAAEEANLVDAKDKIVLFTGGVRPGPEGMERLKKSGALAYIAITGSLYDPKEMIKELRTRTERRKPGDDQNFPGVVIHITEAQKLLEAKPDEVKLVLRQDLDHKSISHNVIATIEGTDIKDKCVVFTAHYDSVIYSSGAWDNGTGSITILELMHYFKIHKPKRTLKFIWCGSEEIGLKGSMAYVEKHEEELKDVLFNINVDMTGVLLGQDVAVCSCDEIVSKYIDVFSRIEGYAIKTRQDMYSSDSTSFVSKGVPAMTFARLAPIGGEEIHSRRDVIDYLDPQKFIDTVNFMARFSEPIINSVVFPVPREIPKDLEEKLERFRTMIGKKPETKKEEGNKPEDKKETK